MSGLEAANDVAPEPNRIGVARVERDPDKTCAQPVFARPLCEERGLSVPRGRAQKRQSAPAALPQPLAQVLPRDERLPRHRDAELFGDDPRRSLGGKPVGRRGGHRSRWRSADVPSCFLSSVYLSLSRTTLPPAACSRKEPRTQSSDRGERAHAAQEAMPANRRLSPG